MVAISQLKWEEWKRINNTILILTSKYKIKILILYNSKEFHPLNLKEEILILNTILSKIIKLINLWRTHMDKLNRAIINHLHLQHIIKILNKILLIVYQLIVLSLTNINNNNNNKLLKGILLIKIKGIIELRKWTCTNNQFNK